MLCLTEQNSRRRPSLLFDATQLTPQESLESPHPSDVHPLFPGQQESGLAGATVIPEVSVSASSPPMTLELQHPLTAVTVTPSPGTVTEGSMILPLPQSLTGATVLPSPPVELLLSPQYYPRPTARKIFSVSRVKEPLPVMSPTVSQTGALGTTPNVVSPTGASSLLPGTPAPTIGISPTLLCQDLAVETVREYIEQIVSDSSLVHQPGSVKAGGDGKLSEVDSYGEGIRASQAESDKEEQKISEEDSELDPLGVLRAARSLPRKVDVVDCDSDDLTDISVGTPDSDSVFDDSSAFSSTNDSLCQEGKSHDGEEEEETSVACVNADGGAFGGAKTRDTMQSSYIPQTLSPEDDDDLFVEFSRLGKVKPEASSQSVASHLHATRNSFTQSVAESDCTSTMDASHLSQGEDLASIHKRSNARGESAFSQQAADENLPNDQQSTAASLSTHLPYRSLDLFDLSMDDEDLSIFTSALHAPSQHSESLHEEGSSAEVVLEKDEGEVGVDLKLAPSETWLAVDASSIAEQQSEADEDQGSKPDFFTSLTLNGLTQELASALIDESKGSGELCISV